MQRVVTRTQHISIYIYIDITLLIDMDFLYPLNLRLHHFSQFFFNAYEKNGFQNFQKLAGLWLVGEIVNHVGIYLDLRPPRVSRHSNIRLVIDFLYHNEAKDVVDIVTSFRLYWYKFSGNTCHPYLYIFCSLRWSLPIISQTQKPWSLPIIEGEILALIARFMGPTWGPSGADRTQVGPMLAKWMLVSGRCLLWVHSLACYVALSLCCFWQRSCWTGYNT